MTGPGAGPGPWYDRVRPVTGFASVLLARNPSPMTLEGTNTWLLRAPDRRDHVVVDPGPHDEAHLRAVAAAGPVAVVLLTHGHADHSAGARRLHELTGAPVRALDPAHRFGAEGLGEGDVVAAAGVELRVLATPGHTGDSLCFTFSEPGVAEPGVAESGVAEPAGKSAGESTGRPADSPDLLHMRSRSGDGGDGGGRASGGGTATAVLTGDTILGRGTTVVAHPDGRLGDYLASLRRLAELGPATVLPGHGPELPDAGTVTEHYLRHRARRLDQVRTALAELTELAERAGSAGPAPRVTAADVVRRVYADTDPALWPAAEMSVRAQLDYLNQET